MNAFSARTDLLPSNQRELWPELRPAHALGFALYGGTAVALRLGHRESVDFDFFTERALDKTALKAALPWTRAPGVAVLQDQPNTYSILTAGGGVKVSFFGRIEFGRIGEPEITSDGVLQVASSEDLLALKIKALFDRVEAKDYRDIAALIRSGTPLERGLAGGQALFGSEFAPMVALKALVHFKGGDLETLPEGDKATLSEAVGKVRKPPIAAVVSRQLAVPSP